MIVALVSNTCCCFFGICYRIVSLLNYIVSLQLLTLLVLVDCCRHRRSLICCLSFVVCRLSQIAVELGTAPPGTVVTAGTGSFLDGGVPSAPGAVGTAGLLDSLNPLRGTIFPGTNKRAATFFPVPECPPTSAKRCFATAAVAGTENDEDSPIDDGVAVGTVNYGTYLPHRIGFSWLNGKKHVYTLVVTVESGFKNAANLKNIIKPEVIKDGTVLNLKTQMPDAMTNPAVVVSALNKYLNSCDFKTPVMVHAFNTEINNIKMKMGLSDDDVPLGSVAEIPLPYVCEFNLESEKVISDPTTGSCILVVTLLKKVEKQSSDYSLDVEDVNPDFYKYNNKF